MELRTKITQTAHERGMTAAEVSRRIGTFRSNISLMDSGKRSVSLQLLGRIAEILGCSSADLLEKKINPGEVFRDRKKAERLLQLDLNVPDGLEKSWVHAVMLAWQNHYRKKWPRS